MRKNWQKLEKEVHKMTVSVQIGNKKVIAQSYEKIVAFMEDD